ncbi:hypothetical protein HMP0721_1884 [Pseudoramibacter alactolyticus ATCC 23263]|uniref:Uncharacterized protein n=1 Tax=Pseudoramibacter alactolyticus ATCC 23263 TaxID=887929 RepID=E6MIP9_9FIRM|nr:hypothetical protein HMP0721_1884 [Pseudoramibacter alactolyticus ATCC 23263]
MIDFASRLMRLSIRAQFGLLYHKIDRWQESGRFAFRFYEFVTKLKIP